jgi:hypothetical protein
VSDPGQPADNNIDALCAQIAAHTQALRHAGAGAAARATERALLADLARVAAMLRADATAIGEALDRVLAPEDARPVTDRPAGPAPLS